MQQFFEDYRVSQDCVDKVANVDYVEISLTDEGIGNGAVQLADTIGRSSYAADNFEQFFAMWSAMKNADAIVFVINSVMLFHSEEREYIATHLARRQMRNVFFVFNRVNCLNNKESRTLLEKAAYQQLHEIFIDKSGRFDKQLFQSRVFYTDAYSSLHARLGEPVEGPYGRIVVDDATTGVPELEAALGEFLTANGRDQEAFRGYLLLLAQDYVAAMDRIADSLRDHLHKIQEATKRQEDYNRKRKLIEKNALQIEDCCQHYIPIMLSDAEIEYENMLSHIKANWHRHFDIDLLPPQMMFLQMSSVMYTVMRNDPEKIEKALRPYNEAILKYIDSEMNEMSKKLLQRWNVNQKILLQELKLYSTLSIEDIADSISKDLRHIMISIARPECHVFSANGLPKKTLLFLCIPRVFLYNVLPITMEKLRIGKNDYIKNVSEQLSKITELGNELTNQAYIQLEHEKEVNDFAHKISDEENALKTEIERTDRICELLLASISEMNQLLNGLPLTESDVRKLAI